MTHHCCHHGVGSSSTGSASISLLARRLVHRFHDEGRVFGWSRGRRDEFGRGQGGQHGLPERGRVAGTEIERLVGPLDQEDIALLGTGDGGLGEAGDFPLVHGEDHFVADLGKDRIGPRVVQLLAPGPELSFEVSALAGHVRRNLIGGITPRGPIPIPEPAPVGHGSGHGGDQTFEWCQANATTTA